MRHRVIRAWTCGSFLLRTTHTLLAAGLLATLLATPLAAQVTFAPPREGAAGSTRGTEGGGILVGSNAALVDTLIDEGRQFEIERRWGEALAHYEDALRECPGELRLEERFTYAKIHYDLGRRYHDNSFKTSVRTLAERDALNLYSEVLTKVQSHYVDEPDWSHLFRRGTVCLVVALEEDVFLDLNVSPQRRNRVAGFRDYLRAQIEPRPVANRQQARDLAATVAQYAEQHLGVPRAATVLEYVCGATNALDEYSSYLTADQLNEVYSQIDGNFVGLGIELKADDGALLITNVIPRSPAEHAGIRADDRIVAVDGRSTRDLSTDAAANLLQGAEGTIVRLDVITPGMGSRRLHVERRQVEIPSISDAHIMDADRGIAYLKLVTFQKTTTRDLDATLWRLHHEGMRSLIIDLRGNPGGLLTASVEVVDKFVDAGTIVSTRGRNPQEDFNYSAHRAGTWRVPLVVLIDRDSASASEIFAGAIRDHRRGMIIGTRSYGKGSVQGIFPLGTARAGLRLTTAKFYSPNGQPYSRVGVSPQLTVEQVARPIIDEAAGEARAPVASGQRDDPVVAAALQFAQQQMAQAQR